LRWLEFEDEADNDILGKAWNASPIRSDLLLQTEAMSEIMERELTQVWKL
jgi:hypothetical protein